MSLVRIPVGSKQYMRVTVTDKTGVLTTITGTSPSFTVKDSADVAKYTDQAATNSGMIILCLIDTMNGGAWALGEYRLWAKFTNGSEIPVLGPYPFTVTA